MTAPTTGPRIKVLIAEDEEHLGAILEQFLLGRGYQVTVTRDGKAALAALRSEAYDVALLDIVMPELDGLEVLRSIREEPAHPGSHHHHRQRHDRDRDHRDPARRVRLPVEAVPDGGDRRPR